MKKIILGSVLFFVGLLCIAIILKGAMIIDFTYDNEWSAMKTVEQFGLKPFLYVSGFISLIGLGLGVWGIIEKE